MRKLRPLAGVGLAVLLVVAAGCTTVRPTGGQAHLDIPDDPGVLAETIAFFRR
jgi:hypothetical protein